MLSDEYSPVRHLATAIFPFSDKHKYMLMLSAYMDETGHAADERQKYVGIAGLMAPAANWERFERKWKEALALPYIGLPYFHMKDFANRKKFYVGWSEEKRRKVLGKLLTVIETAHPLPVGSIVPLKYWRALAPEYKTVFMDPYFLCFQGNMSACTSFLDVGRAPQEERVALVFSEQVEFRHKALKFYERAKDMAIFTRRMARPPSFGDMRELVQLQAADVVAYEMYKEFERREERPDSSPRFGYQRLVKMADRQGFPRPNFFLYDQAELDKQIEVIEKFTHAKKGTDLRKLEKEVKDYYSEKYKRRLGLYD